MSSTKDIQEGDIVRLITQMRGYRHKIKVKVVSIAGDKITSKPLDETATYIADFWMYEPIFNEKDKETN